MIRIPNVSTTRLKWNITPEQVAENNIRLTDIQTKYRSKVEEFINLLQSHKDGIVGLQEHFNFSQKEDAYIVHQMLVKHPNVLISIHDSYAKYTYTSSKNKYVLGIRALGLQFLTQQDSFEIRKKFKTSSDSTFVNILLVMNSLLGLQQHNTSEFNLLNLTTSLALPLDDVLIALSVLKECQFITVKSVKDIPHMYQFTCSDIFNRKDKSFMKNDQTNERNIFSIDESAIRIIDTEYNLAIKWLKAHSSIDYFQFLPSTTKKLTMGQHKALRIKLSEHPNIAFRPYNFDSTRRIIYTFAYVDEEVKASGKSDIVSFRFIPHSISESLIQ